MTSAATASVVDQLRTLMNERASLVTERVALEARVVAERVALEARVSLIDAELAEARTLLDVPAPVVRKELVIKLPTPAETPAPPVATPAPPAAPVDRSEQRRAEVLALLAAGALPTRLIAEALKIDRLLCKMVLQRMKKVGLLETVGQRNGQRWVLAGTPTPPSATRTPKTDTTAIETRDAAVLNRIQGAFRQMATQQELRRWFDTSTVAGSGTDLEKREALMNALRRLKAKGYVSRTHDTWAVSQP